MQKQKELAILPEPQQFISGLEMKGENDKLEQLEVQKRQLESALAQAHLRNIFLETAVECVEKQNNIDVKKTFGDKLSPQSLLSTLYSFHSTIFTLTIFLLCLTFAQPLMAQIANGDEFTFVRIRWTDNNIRYGYGFSTPVALWAHDYPDAEENLYVAIKAATSIKVSEESEVLTFADEDIFKYPFLYACEIGYLTLSQAEINNLREYLMRGGFLVVDDFRWPFEWRNWVNEIRKVLPNSKLQRLSISHPIFHCFFDLNNIHAKTPYLEVPPEYWAMFDDDGRILVIINFNNDVGDGWELPDSTPDFSTMSFKLGINYLIYSYTH